MNPTVRTGRHVSTEQPCSSSVQEIENVFNMSAIAPKKKVFLFPICVPVSVKRLDQDKDADENVDADHVRTSTWTSISEYLYCHMQL